MTREKACGPAAWVTENLAVGGAPLSVEHLQALREQGITAILNLCAEFCDLHEIEAAHGFEVYYMPVHDEEAPDLAELEKALAWLDESIYLDKKVLIHCRHGVGRTGTVLNAYLLRRGLGHGRAGKRLKPLRAKPANFDQWWLTRKYGRAAGTLEVREPCLEYRKLVDLSPWLADGRALAGRCEDLVRLEAGDRERCGRDHDRCCKTPVALCLAEAVCLAQALNVELDSATRLGLIEAAVEAGRRERRAEAETASAGERCLADAGALCPLSREGRCLLYRSRPLQCRSHGLPEAVKTEFWTEVLAPDLSRMSREIYLAHAGRFPSGPLPFFRLPDVVSGRYVQEFFHLLSGASA